jgi:hypothetical protein
MLLSARIEDLAPSGSVFYRLVLQLPGGTTRQYPLNPGIAYSVGQAPGGVPDGHYVVLFYDQAMQLLNGAGYELVIDAVSSGLLRASGSSVPIQADKKKAPAPTQTIEPQPHAYELMSREELRRRYLAEKDPTLRQRLLEADAEGRRMAFVQGSTYVKELGEAYLLNRMMRREMTLMQDSMEEYQRQAFAELGQSTDTFLALQEMQDAVLKHADKHLKPADHHVRTPDYVGLGMAAISALQEVGTTLMDRASISPSNPSERKPEPAATIPRR